MVGLVVGKFKRKQTDQQWAVVGTVLLVWMLLTGCDSLPRLDSLPIPRLAAPDGEEAPLQSLLLVVPQEGEATDRLRDLVASFQSQTGLSVDVQELERYSVELRRTLEGERPPDLFLLPALVFPEYIEMDALAPPLGRLADDGDFYTQLLSSFRHDGILYCLPREMRTLALVYDADVLEEAGMSPPATWQELQQLAAQLTDLDSSRFGLIVSPDLSRWLPFLYQAGGDLVEDERVRFESEAVTEAVAFYISLFRDNVAGQPAESNSSWAGEVLGKGRGVMAVEGTWSIPYFQAEFPDFRYGVAPLPAGPGGRGTVVFTSCYAVSAASSRQDEAFALANYLTAPDTMRRWTDSGGSTQAFMPSRVSLAEEWISAHSDMEPFLNAIDYAKVWQFPPGFDTFLVSFNRSMLELYAADIDMDDFLFELQQVAEGIWH